MLAACWHLLSQSLVIFSSSALFLWNLTFGISLAPAIWNNVLSICTFVVQEVWEKNVETDDCCYNVIIVTSCHPKASETWYSSSLNDQRNVKVLWQAIFQIIGFKTIRREKSASLCFSRVCLFSPCVTGKKQCLLHHACYCTCFPLV